VNKTNLVYMTAMECYEQIIERMRQNYSVSCSLVFVLIEYKLAIANSSAVRFRTLPLRLRSSIPSAVANFASAGKYLC